MMTNDTKTWPSRVYDQPSPHSALGSVLSKEATQCLRGDQYCEQVQAISGVPQNVQQKNLCAFFTISKKSCYHNRVSMKINSPACFENINHLKGLIKMQISGLTQERGGSWCILHKLPTLELIPTPVISCCVADDPKTQRVNTTVILLQCEDFVGHKFGQGLAGQFFCCMWC